MEGRIKMWRSSQDNKMYFSEKFTRRQARQDLILIANHKDGYFYVRGNKIEVKRGQVARGEKDLCVRRKWSRDKTRKFLNDLEKMKQIIQQKNRLCSIYTIINYDKYQTTDQTTDQTTEKHQTRQQKNINKNDNKDKNEKEKKDTAPEGASNYKKFIAPRLELVQEYCNERANGIDAEAFLNHYEAVGRVYGKDRKPVKDWKACVRTRESRNKEKEPKTMEDWLKLKNELGIKEFTKKYGNDKVKEITLHFL